MTEQLERDLSDLFSYATERLDIRPAVAPNRFTRLNVALAAAVTIALVGGVAIAGARLATSYNETPVALGSGDAQTQLLAAFRRTFSEPVEVTSTIDIGGQGRTVTRAQFDNANNEMVMYEDGSIRELWVGGREFTRIADGMHNFLSRLPAEAKWAESDVPTGAGVSAFGNWGLLLGVGGDQITRVGAHKFRVVRGSDPSQPGYAWVDAGGRVIRMQVRLSLPASQGPDYQAFDVSIRRLGHSLKLTAPDPSTVISQARFQAAIDATSRPETCVTSPPRPASAPASTIVSCASGSQRLAASPVPSHS